MDLNSIIKGCLNKDNLARETLYREFKDSLFGLCLKYCANKEDAQDILHTAFVEIFTNIHKFEKRGSLEGWMKRITINRAIDSYKKTFHLTPIREDFYDDTELDDTDLKLSPGYLLDLIQQLPNQYRLVFSLYELDDYSHREIAALLNISENTSKSNLHKAKNILKQKILNGQAEKRPQLSNGK